MLATASAIIVGTACVLIVLIELFTTDYNIKG